MKQLNLFGNEPVPEVWEEENPGYVKIGIPCLDEDEFLTLGHVHFFLFNNIVEEEFLRLCMLLIANKTGCKIESGQGGIGYILSYKHKTLYENCKGHNFTYCQTTCDYAKAMNNTIITLCPVPDTWPLDIPKNCSIWAMYDRFTLVKSSFPYKKYKLFG